MEEMDNLIDSWHSNKLKGRLTRIFKRETYGPLELFTSPNNIAVVTIEKEAKYDFLEKEVDKKVKKDSSFIVIGENHFSLPFDFILKEIADNHKEEYVAIIRRL